MSIPDEYKKDFSTVHMNITTSSPGTYLAECLQPQSYYVSLEIKDRTGSLVARVEMSYEQAARMMLYSGEVPCTLSRYRGLDGKIAVEKIDPPKSVHTKMIERLGDTFQSLDNRMTDLRRDLDDIVEGRKKAGKNAMRDILNEMGVIQGHYRTNQTFVAQRAEEEVCEMQSNAAGQLGVFLESHYGLEAKKEALVDLLGGSQKLLADVPSDHVEEKYELKERLEVSLKDMTANDVAREIHARLRKRENDVPKPKDKKYADVFMPGCVAKKNKVEICYISYQGYSKLSLLEAKIYLTFLRNLKDKDTFKSHHTVLKDVLIECPRCGGDPTKAILDTDGCTFCDNTGVVRKTDVTFFEDDK